MTELDKLEAYLKGRGIPHERIDEPSYPGFEGLERHQIIVYDDRGKRSWDAICNRCSYGGDQGLLEIMGKLVDKKRDGDSVAGWLTAENVINRLEGLK